jgi:ubiquitin-protein ligase
MAPNHALLYRLHKDLSELRDHPYPGISLHHHSATDLHTFCLHLNPHSGPFAGLSLHFEVRLPEQWPQIPPKISSSTQLEHPNIFGGYVCCDLLKLESKKAGYGYTPAFTLRGLLAQFLSFFSSETVEQEGWGDRFVLLGNRGEELVVYGHVDPRDELVDQVRGYQTGFAVKEQKRLKAEFEAAARNCSAQPLVTELPRSKGRVIWPTGRQTLGVVRIEWPNKRYEQTLPKLKAFRCTKCQYNISADFPVEIPENFQPSGRTSAALRVGNTRPATGCTPSGAPSANASANANPSSSLDKLSVELLLGIADLLPSESLNVFSRAYPRFAAIVVHHKLYLYRELTCFFLRTPITDHKTILGIGVNYDSRKKFITSSFDWLSRSAFEEFRVRMAVDKSPTTHFLPLAFGTLHFGRVLEKNALWPRLEKLAVDTIQTPNPRGGNDRGGYRSGSRSISHSTGITLPSDPLKRQQLCLRVLYKLCNSLAVQLMNTSEKALSTSTSSSSPSSSSRSEAEKTLLYASEKVCVGYLQVYHLIVSILKSHPTLRTVELQRLRKFWSDPSARTKSTVPDLGELLVCCAAVAGSRTAKSNATISWPEDLLAPFLREVLTRNSMWVLRDHPELELLETAASKYRAKNTFATSRTSYRLVMFQTLFWQRFIVPHLENPHALETYFGFPQPGSEVAEMMVKGIKEIYAVETYTAFF